MNSIDAVIKKSNQSGTWKIVLAITLIIIAVPLLVWGVGQTAYNGIMWFGIDKQTARANKKINKIKSKTELDNLKQSAKTIKGK